MREMDSHLSKAEGYLDAQYRPNYDQDLVISTATEFESVWAFGFNTREFLVEGDFLRSIVGVGPVVVPKDGNEIYTAPSANPIADYLGEPVGPMESLL